MIAETPHPNFKFEHADGSVQYAENAEMARSVCPVLGGMAVEQANLLLEIAALGQEKIEKQERPPEALKQKTEPVKEPSLAKAAEPQQTATSTKNLSLKSTEDSAALMAEKLESTASLPKQEVPLAEPIADESHKFAAQLPTKRVAMLPFEEFLVETQHKLANSLTESAEPESPETNLEQPKASEQLNVIIQEEDKISPQNNFDLDIKKTEVSKEVPKPNYDDGDLASAALPNRQESLPDTLPPEPETIAEPIQISIEPISDPIVTDENNLSFKVQLSAPTEQGLEYEITPTELVNNFTEALQDAIYVDDEIDIESPDEANEPLALEDSVEVSQHLPEISQKESEPVSDVIEVVIEKLNDLQPTKKEAIFPVLNNIIATIEQIQLGEVNLEANPTETEKLRELTTELCNELGIEYAEEEIDLILAKLLKLDLVPVPIMPTDENEADLENDGTREAKTRHHSIASALVGIEQTIEQLLGKTALVTASNYRLVSSTA